MKPDDITDEEAEAAEVAGHDLLDELAAQNALRDERLHREFMAGLTARLNALGVPACPSYDEAIDALIERVRADERERIAREVESIDDFEKWEGWRGSEFRAIAAAIREGGQR